MSFSIAVGSDQSAYLISVTGEVLWAFPNLDCARKACQDWYATPEVVLLQPSTTNPVAITTLPTPPSYFDSAVACSG